MEKEFVEPAANAALKKEAHTPGPWHIDPEMPVWVRCKATDRPGHGAIADVYDGKRGIHDDDETAEANARLIAAAPDLLIVVQDMLAGLKYLRANNSAPYGFGIDRLEETGCAAILKATSGSRTEGPAPTPLSE